MQKSSANLKRSRRLSTYSIPSPDNLKGACSEIRSKFHEFDTGRKGGLYEIEVMHLLDYMFRSNAPLSLKYKKEFNDGWGQEIVVICFCDITMTIKLSAIFRIWMNFAPCLKMLLYE